MTHLDNLRDPHAMAGQVPFMEQIAKDHPDMHTLVLAASDNEGTRQGYTVRYSNAIQAIRTAHRNAFELQREIKNKAYDRLEEVADEDHGILAPQRMPGTDEHDN